MSSLLQLKGKALKDLIASSKEEKKSFDDIGKQVRDYGHKADEAAIYSNMGLEADLWFKTTVAMTAQAVDLMCPYLYPANPYRCGSVRKQAFADPMAQQLSKVRNDMMVEYLNLTPDETDLYGESVRAINQSQIYGGGLLWTGLDERKGLVHSVYGSVDELGLDPDALSMDRSKWIYRKREKKRWELADEIPESKNLIAAIQPKERSKTNIGKNNDLVEYYEVWMRVGIHRYFSEAGPELDEKGEPIQYTDQPRKFCVTEDGKVLKETTWEAPLFVDNLWPVEMVSYIEDEDSVWPISPMRAGLPFQKALNWLFVFYMTKIRFTSRSLFAMMNYGNDSLGQDNLAKVQMLDDMPILNIRVDNDQIKLGDLFQQLNLNPGLENFEKAHTIIKREFQEHTGLYDILHYGEGETQDRSATATNFKEKTAKTRLNYRSDRVKKWQGRVARKEAMVARFIHTPEQIDVILGPGSGQLWGQIMPPQEAAADPLGVSFQSWYLETDYTIEADSMRRNDHQTKIDALKDAMNTVVPVQIQSIDLSEKAVAYDTIAEYLEAIGATDTVVQKNTDLANYFRQQAQMQAAMAEQQMAMQQQQLAAQQQSSQDAQIAQQQNDQILKSLADGVSQANKAASDTAKHADVAARAAQEAVRVAKTPKKKRKYKVMRGADKSISHLEEA